MMKLETGIMVILWDQVLQHFQMTSASLQSSGKRQNFAKLQCYRLIIDNSLESCFPNVEIALRIYLSLMVTNCSG